MKLRLLSIAIFLSLTINGFAQFEKKSVHIAATLRNYFQYGGMISYFPIKNLELGIESSFRTREGQTSIYPNRTRWAIGYKMNYYISDWIIKPKIVGLFAYSKNNQKTGKYYTPGLARYQTFNGGLGIGLSARIHKRIRIEGDITYNKFSYNPETEASSVYFGENPYSSMFLTEVTLSYQIAKLK